MIDVKVIVGGSIEDDAAAFLKAWHDAERGKKVRERVLAFESWEGLAQVMTGERYRLLRHLHGHPEPSVSALARALGRQYRRVHADVAALEQAGLVADRIGVEIRL
jgi:predicted transcriptional regulator